MVNLTIYLGCLMFFIVKFYIFQGSSLEIFLKYIISQFKLFDDIVNVIDLFLNLIFISLLVIYSTLINFFY